MAYKDLRDYIRQLENKGLLVRIKTEVDPILEISEITDKVCKSLNGGKALFFEKVRGSVFPVVTNLFGSFERMCLALEAKNTHRKTGPFPQVARNLKVLSKTG